MSEKRTKLQAVEPRAAWGIFGGSVQCPGLYNSPAEALAKFILDPANWPEDVDFWLALCDWGACREDALGRVREGMKRPIFYNLRLLREFWACREGNTHIDFWFLGRMIEVLVERGFTFLFIEDEPIPVPLLVAVPDWSALAEFCVIRRQSNWRSNFIFVRDPSVTDWLGVEATFSGTKSGRPIVTGWRQMRDRS